MSTKDIRHEAAAYIAAGLPPTSKRKASSKDDKVAKPGEPRIRASYDAELANLAKRLKLLREKQQISQSELARRCGIDHGAVSRTEAGQSGPSWETLKAIAKGLGIPIYALFTDELNIAVFSAGIEASLRHFVDLQTKSLAFAESLLAEMEAHRAKRSAMGSKEESTDRHIEL